MHAVGILNFELVCPRCESIVAGQVTYTVSRRWYYHAHVDAVCPCCGHAITYDEIGVAHNEAKGRGLPVNS
jgi:RNase P subunit RPR2